MASKSRLVHGASVALMSWAACLLGGCPSTIRCADGETFDGTRCVPFDDDADAPNADVPETDVPCGGCTSPLVCDFGANECVECLGTDASTCTAAGDNACFEGECVACDDDADCESLAAPQCDVASHVCVACDGPEACAGRAGTLVCGASGACVECSAADETACGTDVCDVESGSCTDVGERTVGVCSECTSNRACSTGSTCVLQRFDEPPVDGTLIDIGYVCLPTAGASCTAATAPFVNREMLLDRTGASVPVCGLRVATCPAHLAYGTTECTTDTDCGIPDVDDGLCRMGSPDTSSGRACSTRCTAASDCRSGIGCSSSAPQYCCFGPSCT